MVRFGVIHDSAKLDNIMLRYEDMRLLGNWNPTEDIDWNLQAKFNDKKRALSTELALQGSYTEEVGLLVAARLIEMVDDLPTRYCLGVQAADEAKHSEVFARYSDKWAGRIDNAITPPKKPLTLLNNLIDKSNTLELFTFHTMLEGLALDQFSMLVDVFEGDTLGQIYRHVRMDEARHVAMGMDFMKAALRRIDPDEALSLLKKCRAELFSIAHVDDSVFDAMGEITGYASSVINQRLSKRVDARFDLLRCQFKEIEK